MNLTILIITFSLFLTVAPGLACDPLDQPRTRVTRPDNQVVDFDLTKVELPNGTVVEYVIDANDRRVGRPVGGNVTHRWLYHGPLTPIAELDNQGQVIARYVYGSQDQVPDYLLMGEVIYRLVTDHLGSVRLVVNVMTGEVVQRLDYDVWGNVLQDTNPGFQPFGFAGGLYDSLTGLVHWGSRDYDPQVGRWTTKDPIGFASEDTNLYAYVYNDPVNQIDPSGLFLNLIAGCLVSGGIELASQMIIDGKSLGCVDWGSVALETATGCNPFSKWKKVSKVVEGAQCVLGNSFVAGTLVHTDQGLKPIEEVKVGEKVKSFNERTGQTSYEPVLELMQHDGTFQLVKVTLDSGENLEATVGHPFYVQGKGWNVAANLKVEDALRLHNGTTLVVKTVDTSTRFAKVYNFAVASNANYFVGMDGVLVHNGCKGGGKNAKHANQKRREVAETAYKEAKEEYEKLKASLNKTPDIKEQLEKAYKAMNKAKRDMDFTGEHHSQNSKGNR